MNVSAETLASQNSKDVSMNFLIFSTAIAVKIFTFLLILVVSHRNFDISCNARSKTDLPNAQLHNRVGGGPEGLAIDPSSLKI